MTFCYKLGYDIEETAGLLTLSRNENFPSFSNLAKFRKAREASKFFVNHIFRQLTYDHLNATNKYRVKKFQTLVRRLANQIRELRIPACWGTVSLLGN